MAAARICSGWFASPEIGCLNVLTAASLLEGLLLLDQLGIIARRDREIDDVPRAQVLPDEHEPIGVRMAAAAAALHSPR